MISVRLVTKVKGKNPITRIDEFQSLGIATAQATLIDVANVVREEMVRIIQGRKRQRFQNKNTLENNIQVDILLQTNSRLEIGIGNISRLNSLAPYWAALNSGFTPPTINKKIARGSFDDGKPDPNRANSGGIWYVGQGLQFYTFSDKKLHKAVRPFSYIDIADSLGNALLISLDRRIRDLGRK